MDMGKLNVYYVSSELKIGTATTPITSAYFTNATETEFKELLDNYSSENEADPHLSGFISYVTANGYYCTVLGKEVLNPSGSVF
jgi:hypothetical protein